MGPARYARIIEEIRNLRAWRLLEVGTWNGDRAIQMMDAALENSGHVRYFGFDLFEDMTESKSATEFNVKAPMAEDQVSAKLAAWIAAEPRGKKTFLLRKGDTAETLPAFLEEHGPALVDFAWIDGGHSLETIRRDWLAVAPMVRPGGIILLDDYYEDVPGADGRFGCNQLVEDLQAGDHGVDIGTDRDPVKGGGTVRIVRVRVPA